MLSRSASRCAEAGALGRIGLGDLDAALRQAEPAHAMGQPRRAEADLRHLQALPFAQEHILRRDLQAVELDLAVAAMLLRAHDRDAAHDPPARLVLVEQEGGEAVARVVRGAGDEDEMLASSAPVMNHLRPCTTYVLPALLGPGLDHRWDRSRRRDAVRSWRRPSVPRHRTIGCSQRSFCSVVPTASSTIMLPSSGAAELKRRGQRSSGSWPRSRRPCRLCRDPCPPSPA